MVYQFMQYTLLGKDVGHRILYRWDVRASSLVGVVCCGLV
jgi:hypothetical protein